MLKGGAVGAKGAHTPDDFLNRQAGINWQAGIGMIRHYGRTWHGWRCGFLRVLHKSCAAVSCDSP